MHEANMSFFNLLKESGKYTEAYIVIKNYFNNNRDDEQIFLAFVDLGLKLSALDIMFDERKGYLNEVSNALAIYTDYADMSESTLEVISNVTEQIGKAYDNIVNSEQMYIKEQQKRESEKNNDILQRLAEQNELLKKVSSQLQFDQKLKDITCLEENLNKENFTENQQMSYDTLTKHYSDTISRKMEELHKIELLEINKKAIKAFKNVFDLFTAQKKKYKESESDLKALVVHSLFAFDSRDLFNETLVYYNHIYSLIFNEISDDMKYKLTEWSLKASQIKK